MTDEARPMEYSEMNLQELIKIQAELSFQRDELKDRVTALNKKIDLLRNSIIPDKMEDEGIDSIKITGVGRVSLYPMTQVSVRNGKQPELQEWLKSQDAQDLIKPTVNASTLKAYINERIRSGEDYPDDIINFNAFSQARITKG
jgi:hypothetical protein